MGYSIYPAPSAASRSERTVFITSTQSWTAPADVTSVDILLVGGGGGAGGNGGTATASGGGGGGGVLQDSVPVTPNTAYTITIGAGGAGGPTTREMVAMALQVALAHCARHTVVDMG